MKNRPKPRSLCTCGHTGDGSKSLHQDTVEPGHGACLMDDCDCRKFVWESWLPWVEAEMNARERDMKR